MAKTIPQRMCVGCRTMKSKKELIRVVRSPIGEISLDGSGKKPGRGAYICPDPQCLKMARKNKGLEKAFKVKIDDEIWEEINSQLPKAKAEQKIEETL